MKSFINFTFLFIQCYAVFISKNKFKISFELENFEKMDDSIVNMYLDPKNEDTSKFKYELDGFLVGLQGYVNLVKQNVPEFIEKSFALKKQGSPYSVQIRVDREEFIRKMGWGEKDIKHFDDVRAKIQSTWKELLGLLEKIDPKRFNKFDCFLKDNPVYDSAPELDDVSYHALEDD